MAPPRKKPAPVTLRGMLSQVSGEDATLDRVREITQMALDIDQWLRVTCPDCQAEFRAQVPDVSKMLRNAIEILEQVEGKAGDQPPGALTVVVERAAR